MSDAFALVYRSKVTGKVTGEVFGDMDSLKMFAATGKSMMDKGYCVAYRLDFKEGPQ